MIGFQKVRAVRWISVVSFIEEGYIGEERTSTGRARKDVTFPREDFQCGLPPDNNNRSRAVSNGHDLSRSTNVKRRRYMQRRSTTTGVGEVQSVSQPVTHLLVRRYLRGKVGKQCE